MKRFKKNLSIFLSMVMIGLSISPLNTPAFAEINKEVSVDTKILSTESSENGEFLEGLKEENSSIDL